MKSLIFFFTCLLFTGLSFATTFSPADLSCPSPQSLTKVAESSGSISFDWDDCSNCGSQSFQVYFVKDGNVSAVYQVSRSDISFTGLEAGDYEFHFVTVCGGSLSAEIIIVEDVIVV